MQAHVLTERFEVECGLDNIELNTRLCCLILIAVSRTLGLGIYMDSDMSMRFMSVQLFCSSVSHTQHLSLRQPTCSSVSRHLVSSVATRLRQCHTQRHHKASDGSSAVRAQCGSETGVQQS